ncbi:EGF-like repeat and discoidin I-like domain-containing protein 3 [Patiria miniata]|uniref:F5/8 type C domain-containing protein n=1 Tax=Patiria miniata TaxID=46514 RepID=A0A914A9Q3_PATMI|nr:EGF-like repeat and discoidin I-like domain-containing protein 3 [Patiria miniata]
MIVDEPTPNNIHCYGYRGNYVTTASDIPNIRLIVPGSGALPVLIADIKVKTCWLVMKNPRKMWVFSWTLWLFSSFFILPVRGNTCSAMVQAAPGDDLTALRNKAFASFRAQCRGKRDDVSCSVEGPLGMEDGRIRDERITASSFWRNLASHAPSRARLNTQASDIPNIRLIVPGSGALPVLIADIKVKTCWLVMKNPRKMWVFSWTLWLFSSFFILPVRGNTCSAMVQAAPGDDLTALRNKAFASFRAQCRGKRDDVSCSVEGPLGMEDGRIRDERITASSFWRNLASHAPSRARLNTQGYAAAWCNDETTDDISPWIQVHFDGTVTITGLITQGRGDSPCDQWVTEYQVTYSEDGPY